MSLVGKAFDDTTRSPKNMFTGKKLSGFGKGAMGVWGGAKIGTEVAKNTMGLNQAPIEKATGLSMPLQMSYDGRTPPTMGADGDLTLALSKLNQP